MSSFLLRVRSEFPHLLKLAIPVVIAELGWMFMGVIDIVMVGRMGPEAIGAVAIGNMVFNCIGLIGLGVMLGLDTLVAQSFGAGNREDCDHSLRQALWVGTIVGPIVFLAMELLVPTMDWWGMDPGVAALAKPFTGWVALSVFPVILYAACRRYLQSMGIVRPVMIALVTANINQVFFNWLLIEGNLGAPALGVTGAAIATVLSRAYMAVFLVVVITRKVLYLERPDWDRIRLLFQLGIPAAGHIFLEVAVFGAVTALAARFPPVALAAHEIALNYAAMSFMVPLGISSAAAVRVGQALGKNDVAASRLAGWTAILTGMTFMGAMGIIIYFMAPEILRIYTPDHAVIEFGIPLLYWAAMFQLFDGIQVVSTGALRGRGDTHSAFKANMVGHWMIGLPVGAYLCFVLNWGVAGLWAGLTLGLILVSLYLLRQWAKEED